MDPGTVKATIRMGIRSAEQATAGIVKARDQGMQAAALAETTTEDSRHRYVRDGHASCREAAHEAGLVIKRLTSSTRAAQQYLEVIG